MTALAMTLLAGATTMANQPAEAAFPGLNGKIAFTSNRDGDPEIYVMNADGSNQTPLTINAAIDGEPAWSPDGRSIVFASERDGNREIYKMAADGSNQTRLTYNDARDRTPAWTVDGRIVFDRAPTGISCALGTDVFIMDDVGGNVQPLTSDPAVDCAASGSSSGRIAFTTFREGNGRIYTMAPNGTDLQRVTNTPACDIYPSWSPNAARIVFVRDEALDCNGTDNDIYLIDPNGGNEQRLTTTPSRVEFWVAWSPAGDKLAFDGCARPSGPCQIYTMNSTGGGEQLLTSIGSNFKPDWQPTQPPPPPPPPPTSTSTSTSSTTTSAAADPLPRAAGDRAPARPGEAADPPGALLGRPH